MITCLECKNKEIVPLGGVKQLPMNFFVNHLIEELVNKRTIEGDKEIQCDNCDENDVVVAFCPSCTLFLCEICRSYHKRDRITCNHSTVVLYKVFTDLDQTFINTLQCKEHGSNELQCYCETCDELICMYCTVREHKDHNHIAIKNMVDIHTHLINYNIATTVNILRNFSKLPNDIEMMINKINYQESKVIKEVDSYYDTLIEKVTEQKIQIIQQVHITTLEKVKTLTLQLIEIDSIKMQVIYMKELTDFAKKDSNPDKLLSIQKQVATSTKKLVEVCSKLDTQPVELDTIQFFSNEVPFPQFGHVFSKADPCESEIPSLPKYIFLDTPIEFTITAKYGNGFYYPRGGNKISVQAQLLPVSWPDIIVSTVKDNKNGTYTVTITSKKVGKVQISVFIDGKKIKGSPYITVASNYPAVTKPTDIIDISGHSHNAKPWGIAFGKRGVWAVADWTNHCVCMFYKEDQLLWKFGAKGCNDGQLDSPCGIAFDDNNHLYVADYNNHRVLKFDINGNYILQFTGKKSGDGCLSTPVDITIHEGMVYVTDATANCVVKFYTNGQFCQVIGKGYLNNPNGVTVNYNNHLLVTNPGDDCVYTFTLDGQYLSKFGTSGPGRGQLSCPRSITSDINDFILITDTGNHRISIFDKYGEYVHSFGCKGTRNSQFLAPCGIALAPNGSIYISDSLNRCIKIFEV